MGHKDNADDVIRWWVAFLEITGQRSLRMGGGPGSPELEKDGASWRVRNGPESLASWLYGAAAMVLALRAYCDGWKGYEKATIAVARTIP